MLKGKYPTWKRYYLAKVRRWPILLAIAPLVRWKPIIAAREGYTIVVACHARLAAIMIPGLRLLAAQDLSRMERTFVAFDAPRSEELVAFADRLVEELPELRITCLYQSPLQSRILRIFNWGWIDCWLSYCLGLARVETRYAMLHDMDAMLLKPGLVESRYDAILQHGYSYLGNRWYATNGILAEDRIAIIVEIFLDAGALRSRFRPVDLFNKIRLIGDHTADLDILLYPQVVEGRSEVIPLTEQEWVHPTQVVSQFTYQKRSGRSAPVRGSYLWFIPYLLDLAGTSPGVLEEHTRGVLNSDIHSVPLLDRSMDISLLSAAHLRWVIKQMLRIERSVCGRIRPEVRAYLDTIQSRLSDAPAESLVDEVNAELDAEANQTVSV